MMHYCSTLTRSATFLLFLTLTDRFNLILRWRPPRFTLIGNAGICNMSRENSEIDRETRRGRAPMLLPHDKFINLVLPYRLLSVIKTQSKIFIYNSLGQAKVRSSPGQTSVEWSTAKRSFHMQVWDLTDPYRAGSPLAERCKHHAKR